MSKQRSVAKKSLLENILQQLSTVEGSFNTSKSNQVLGQFRRLGVEPDEIEWLIWALVLAPHISSEILDEFFYQSFGEGEFPQIGGIRGKQHRGIIPTAEMALFLISDNKENKLFLRQKYLSPKHWLFKKKILILEPPLTGEPTLSGKLLMSSEYVAYFLTGKMGQPNFSIDFPAQLISTRLEWSDLVLHPYTYAQIGHLKDWLKFGNQVLQNWNLSKLVAPGYRALFYGPPGTGKSLTASLLGSWKKGTEEKSSQDIAVYRIDLSVIVSKYIGETEKNLAKLFDKAEHKNWILFFDEADALFGKRTGVNNSNDRYANQEISYLLQRIETYDGLVILATNLKENIDEAFLRRFQSIIHFPMPRPSERLRLWKNSIPAKVQLESMINLEELAQQYELTGADIANVMYYCCIKSMSRGEASILHIDLLEGIRKELAKKGKHTAF